jgi:hypothetical protein
MKSGSILDAFGTHILDKSQTHIWRVQQALITMHKANFKRLWYLSFEVVCLCQLEIT